MKAVAIDTEASSIDPYSAKLTHISWCTEKGAYAVRVTPRRIEKLKRRFFERRDYIKVFHNAKYDLRVLRNAGIRVCGPVADTLVMSQLLMQRKAHGLKALTRDILRERYDEQDEIKKYLKKNKLSFGELMENGPDELILPYARKDAASTLKLWFFFSTLMTKRFMWPVFRREMKLMESTVMRMEQRGMLLDFEECDRLQTEAKRRAAIMLRGMRRMLANPDFKPASPVQVARYVFPSTDEDFEERQRVEQETGTLLPVRKPYKMSPGGKPCCDEFSLKRANTPLSRAIIKYKKFNAVDRKYIHGFLAKAKDGVVHTSFNQNGARTGRFSADSPNLLNLPRSAGDSLLSKVRGVFKARDGFVFLFLDYDQIELKLAAHFSGQQYMIDTILAGGDLHDETAKLFFHVKPSDPHFKRMRSIAKTMNFAMLYGCGPRKLSEILLTNAGVRISTAQCREHIDRYWEVNDRVGDLRRKLSDEIFETGGIRNPFGRFIPAYPDEDYKGCNLLIQSTAADILKSKMPLCSEILRGTKSYLILQVYDEMGFELHKTERHLIPLLRDTMEERLRFSVPITCSASWGYNWYAKKGISNKRLKELVA